jgi:hypothetical protein
MESNKDKGPNAGAKGIDAINSVQENWRAERAARRKAITEPPPTKHRFNPEPTATVDYLKRHGQE